MNNIVGGSYSELFGKCTFLSCLWLLCVVLVSGYLAAWAGIASYLYISCSSSVVALGLSFSALEARAGVLVTDPTSEVLPSCSVHFHPGGSLARVRRDGGRL